MPNLRGGKAYKKSKGKSKAYGEDTDIVFIEKELGQLVGRITKILGNLNVSVYCEDKIQRICKIRSGIKKKVRFETGDIILVSLRDCEVSASDLEKGIRSDRGDVIEKYNPRQYSSLKEEGVNPLLFVNLDKIQMVTDLIDNGQVSAAENLMKESEDDIFDRGGGSDDDLNIDDI